MAPHNFLLFFRAAAAKIESAAAHQSHNAMAAPAIIHITRDGKITPDAKISCAFCARAAPYVAVYLAQIEKTIIETAATHGRMLPPPAMLHDIVCDELTSAARAICIAMGDFPAEFIDDDHISALFSTHMIDIIDRIQKRIKAAMLLVMLEGQCPEAAAIIRHME